MLVDAPSTLASRDSLRLSTARIQVRLDAAAAEVSSGSLADPGLVLGAQSAKMLDLRGLTLEIESVTQSNALLASRLTQTQSALTSMVDLANGFFEALVASRQDGLDRGAIVADARARLSALNDLLATTSSGAYIFSGENTDTHPLLPYDTDPPTGPRSTVHATFVNEFGFPPDDPRASAISAPQLQSYLTQTFATLFREPSWQAEFSSVGAGRVDIRASLSEVVTIPVDADSQGIRTFVSALVAVIDTGMENLAADAFTQLIDVAASMVATAGSELVRDQGKIGILQDRVTSASARMAAQKTLIETQIGAAEGVDLLEASSRLNRLMAQLDLSYAVTSRLQQLSLLNYL